MAKIQAKKIVCVGPRKVEIQDFIIDTANIERDSFIAKTKWSLISPGTEIGIYSGENKMVFQKDSWCAYPWDAGYINIAEVVEVGDGIKDLKEGDVVFNFGPHSSYIKIDTNTPEGLYIVLPETQQNVNSLFARIASISRISLIVTEKPPGSTVLIYGLGLVGNFCAQLFQLGGFKTVAVEVIEKRIEWAKECGIENIVNPKVVNLKEFSQEFTKKQGFDIVVDAVGVPDIVCEAVELSAPYGEVILLGTPKPEMTKSGLALLNAIHHKFLTVKSGLEWILFGARSPYTITMKDNIVFILEEIEKKRLKVEPLITHKIPYSDIRSAYEGLLNKKDEYLGVILEW